MHDLDHNPAAFARLGAEAQIYLRPSGFVDGPLMDPDACRRLAGGAVWFSAVHVIARTQAGRCASCLVPVPGMSAFLEALPDPQRLRALDQWRHLTSARTTMPLPRNTRTLRFDQPMVMGILNMTPDSFSDGGRLTDKDAAATAAWHMAEAGAALVDIGGESTRPGAKPVWEQDEIDRVAPVLERLGTLSAGVSLDTRKAAVMRAGLKAGVDILNDVSALTWDPESLAVAAASPCPIVLMHAQGSPESMQDAPAYADALLDVYDWLEARVLACEAAGIARTRLILDPGVGFGKALRHNLDVLNGLSLFHALGCPLLVGVSRKRFIGALGREEPVDKRLPGTLAAVVHCLAQGVQILRVHDVTEAVQALRIWQGLRDAALTA